MPSLVPIPESDERFKRYLRTFRPLAPEPLKTIQMTSRPWRVAAWTGAAVAAALVLIILPHRLPVRGSGEIPIADLSRTLTIGRANALLARAPSYQSAIDVLAFPSEEKHLVDGTSAFAVLSKEKKL